MQYLSLVAVLFLTLLGLGQSTEIFVSPQGEDRNPGTLEKPVATLTQAQKLAQAASQAHEPVTVYLRGGTYRLDNPLILTSKDSGTKEAPAVYQAYAQETVVMSGGSELPKLDWQPYKEGIFQAKVPDDLQLDQLFADGELQRMARYPNYNPNVLIYNGYASDAISPERVAKWADPSGGFIHAQHKAQWGGFSWRIKGKKPDGSLDYEGGWQNNRSSSMHKDYRFVENIFEELDAPGEWYLDQKTHQLYFFPPANIDLKNSRLEYARLKELVEFQGSEQSPVRWITLKGLVFRHSLRTFMETKEPLLRTDWAIYRGGALFFNGTEDCALENCTLDQLGGNAVFVNCYNRRLTIRGDHIFKAGAGGINFVGEQTAARNPLYNYDKRQNLEQISLEMGPANNNYPAQCLVDNCLIHETGQIEKQSAPVNIDLASEITVRHCSIYNCPRAGLNIGDGCWGGHVVEFCDIFDTVRETGDHGSFNAWGRDRWWGLGKVNLDTDIATKMPDLPKLDAVKTTYLRNTRWRCDHGWDIDLDDGSTNYVISNNLCLNGGIKNREGFYRVVENNVIVNSSFHPHVWYADCQDIFRKNILWQTYRPAAMKAPPWGKEFDYNFLHQYGAGQTQPALELQKQSGGDLHSLSGDAQFMDPLKGDYRVKEGSPALALGFVNFPMDQFGVQSPELKRLALTPEFPDLTGKVAKRARDGTTKSWSSAQVRNIRDEGEMSAYGTAGVTGVLVLQVESESAVAKSGLKSGDVIVNVNGVEIKSASDLLLPQNSLIPGKPFKIGILREQKSLELR